MSFSLNLLCVSHLLIFFCLFVEPLVKPRKKVCGKGHQTVEWSTQLVEALIDEWQVRVFLYDPADGGYFNTKLRAKAMEEITKNLSTLANYTLTGTIHSLTTLSLFHSLP